MSADPRAHAAATSPDTATDPEALFHPPADEDARREAMLRSEYLRAMAEEAEARRVANRSILVGLAWLVLGIVVTVATYSSASQQGGTYLVAWGPVVYGLIQIVRGLASRP